MSDTINNQDPIDVTDLFCHESFHSGQGPINQVHTKKIRNQSFTNESNDSRIAHIFEDEGERELGLYRLQNGEYWLFEDVGGQKPRYELSYLGDTMEDVIDILFP